MRAKLDVLCKQQTELELRIQFESEVSVMQSGNGGANNIKWSTLSLAIIFRFFPFGSVWPIWKSLYIQYPGTDLRATARIERVSDGSPGGHRRL